MEGTATDSKSEEEASTNGQPTGDVAEASIAITRYVENAKSASREAADIKTSLASLLTDYQTKLADIEAAKTQALAAVTKIEDFQTVVATKSAHIQGALEHGDKVRDDLDKQLIVATQHATDSEGQKTRSQTAATDAAKLLADIRTTVGTIEVDATAVKATLTASKESAALIKELADKAKTIQSQVEAYENRLEGFEKQCAAQLKTIESLLPGATSAGLAHSFDERRKTFLKPHNMWQIIFVISVLCMVGVALTGFWHLNKLDTIPTFEEALRLWLARIPFAAPFIYLAYYASRESGLAKRLEEEYGNKAAISSCFEGFRKQMAEINENVSQEHPLAKLCENTLRTIANPPGRIYEKHKPGVTPGEAMKSAIGLRDKP